MQTTTNLPPILQAVIKELGNAPNHQMHIGDLANAIINNGDSQSTQPSLRSYISQLVRGQKGHGVKKTDERGYYKLSQAKSPGIVVGIPTTVIRKKESKIGSEPVAESDSISEPKEAEVQDPAILLAEIQRLQSVNQRKTEMIMSLCQTITLAAADE